MPARGAALRPAPCRGARHRRRGDRGSRTVNSLPRPAPSLARLDAAAVQLDDAAHQREADAEAAARAIERALALREEVEDPRQQLGRDADAGVRARGARRSPVRARSSRHGEPPAGRVLDRVVEQVGDHLLEPRRVGVDQQRVGRQLER